MAKFRIKYTSLTMVDDISVQPRKETQDFFDKIISEYQNNGKAENQGSLFLLFPSCRFNIRKY